MPHFLLTRYGHCRSWFVLAHWRGVWTCQRIWLLSRWGNLHVINLHFCFSKLQIFTGKKVQPFSFHIHSRRKLLESVTTAFCKMLYIKLSQALCQDLVPFYPVLRERTNIAQISSLMLLFSLVLIILSWHFHLDSKYLPHIWLYQSNYLIWLLKIGLMDKEGHNKFIFDE